MKLIYKETGLPHYISPLLESTKAVRHLYSTRLGGVSTGYQKSLNLSYKMEPASPENVRKNFEIVAQELDCRIENMVGADQTHTSRVCKITKNEAGNAVIFPSRIKDFDGMITNDEKIVLFITTADCVPILILDPVRRAVGAVHSGWRGTLGGIALNAVRLMEKEYGSKPEDILASIGPSICVDCYEVSEGLFKAFSESELYSDADIIAPYNYEEKPSYESDEYIFYKKVSDKYQLNLWRANERVLLKAGLRAENIEIGGLCTCHNPDLLFSHRASGGKRGGLGAFIGLSP